MRRYWCVCRTEAPSYGWRAEGKGRTVSDKAKEEGTQEAKLGRASCLAKGFGLYSEGFRKGHIFAVGK